jgi:hypothetical protein
MHLFIERAPSTLKSTSGKLYVDGVFWLPVKDSPSKAAIYTLEDVVREVKGQPVEGWKIKGQTAIPAGLYRVDYTESARFKRKTLILLNVPGFTGIRFHGGNHAEDTEGCILCGNAKTGPDSIAVCAPAIALLESLVCPELEAGREVWCTLDSAPVQTEGFGIAEE